MNNESRSSPIINRRILTQISFSASLLIAVLFQTAAGQRQELPELENRAVIDARADPTLLAENLARFKSKLNAATSQSGSRGEVVLFPASVDGQGEPLLGACGQEIKLPSGWSTSGRFWLGVTVLQPVPDTTSNQQRKERVQRWRNSYQTRFDSAADATGASPGLPAIDFSVSQLPVDLVVSQRGANWQLGIDLNSDFEISESESISVGTERPTIVAFDKGVLLIGKLTPTEDSIQTAVWSIPFGSRKSELDRLLNTTETKLIWLDQDTETGNEKPDSKPAFPEPSWWSEFKNDAQVREVEQRVKLGKTPEEILQSAEATFDPQHADLLTARRVLVAFDQFDTRKQNLEKIIELASLVLSLAEQEIGSLPPAVDPATTQRVLRVKETDLLETPAQRLAYAWAVDAAYRKTRAIGYRELPQVIVVHPIKDAEKQHREFESSFKLLAGLVTAETSDLMNHPEFILTRVRRQRRMGNLANSLELLEMYREYSQDAYWYHKKKADLYQELEVGLPERWHRAQWFRKEHNVPLMREAMAPQVSR